MKKTIKMALLSLAATTGVAVAVLPSKPVVSVVPEEAICVQPNEAYVFHIYYQLAETIVVTINDNTDDSIWLWPWQQASYDVKIKDYTDEIPYYNMEKRYKVTAQNERGESFAYASYYTSDDPNPQL